MYAGLKHADADYVVVMDADLQHPPAVFPQINGNVSARNCLKSMYYLYNLPVDTDIW